MRRVILESPYAGGQYVPASNIQAAMAVQKVVDENIKYARACLHDCLNRGEAPFASHLLYTQVLDDEDKNERRQGIVAGQAWLSVVDAVVVYQDFGISKGMREGIDAANAAGVPVEYRCLYASASRLQRHVCNG